MLSGRIILEHLDPLSFWELGPQFNLEKVLRIGALPGVYLDEKEGLDIVLEMREHLVGIECKYGKNVSEQEMTGLRSLEAVAHKPVKKFVVYAGESRQRFSKGETAVFYKEFLDELTKGVRPGV